MTATDTHPTSILALQELVKTFVGSKAEARNRVRAIDGISFEITPGSMFTLLGPSGCGKTTTLRCIAGLERPDSGRIEVDGRVFFGDGVSVPANERGLGMVFQSYAIWPHMNVFKNVAFPLEVRRRSGQLDRHKIRAKVEEVLEVVKLHHLMDRQATDLSGGQQQRLALARALVMEPKLMLLDEPLSNLDAKLREEMRFELKNLQRRLGVTAIYVTHDQVEALAMSNQIAVMNHGRIEQIGKPREIYEKPASRFVADFIGTTNFVDGIVESVEASETFVVRTPAGTILARSSVAHRAGDKVTVVIRPEHVTIEKDTGAPGLGLWNGTVTARAFLGEAVDHVISVGSIELRARCNPTISIPPATEVALSFGGGTATILPVPD